MLLFLIVDSLFMRDKNDIVVIAPLLSAGEAGFSLGETGLSAESV